MKITNWLKENQAVINLIFAGVVAVFTIFNALLWWDAKQQLNLSKDELKISSQSNQGNFLLTLNQDFFFNDRLYKLRKAIESNQPIFQPKGQFAEAIFFIILHNLSWVDTFNFLLKDI